MANPGFYNDNQYRDYPFESRVSPLSADEGVSEWSSSSAVFMVAELLQTYIVDFGAIIRPSAQFSTGVDYVYLRSISRSGTALSFVFVLSSMSIAYAITFTVDTATAAEFHTVWSDSAVLAVVSEIYACDDTPVWSAYLVTGDLSQLLVQLDDGDTLFYVTGLWRIIPGRLQNLIGTQVQSIAIANIRRTVVAPTTDCGDPTDAATSPPTAYLVASCMVGDIKLQEGYNCNIRHDLRANAIIVNAGSGNGEGQPCEEVEIYPGEAIPDDSNYYSGGPACADIVRSINGVSVSDLVIRAGAGFSVGADADLPNTLVIERTLQSFRICVDAAIPVIEEESLSSADSASESIYI